MTLKEVKKLNKAQLTEYAESIGIEVKEDMSKAVILDLVKNSGKLDENPAEKAAETTAEGETTVDVTPASPAEGTANGETSTEGAPAEGTADGETSTEGAPAEGTADEASENPETVVDENQDPPTEAEIQAKVEEVNSIRLAMALELSKRQSKVSAGIAKCANIGNALGIELARRASKYGSVSTIPASPEEISAALDQELARRQAKNK